MKKNEILVFRPTMSSEWSYSPKVTYSFGVFFAICIIVGMIFFQWPVSFLSIVVIYFVVINLRQKNLAEWDVGGYKIIKIDLSKHLIWLDNESIFLYDIDYAEVFFRERPSSYWISGNSGMGYAEFINAELFLKFKNGEHRSIPIQYKSCLKKIVIALRKYIVVKFDKNDLCLKGGVPSFIWVLVLVGFLFAYFHVPALIADSLCKFAR